jgi:predicted acyltransferase
MQKQRFLALDVMRGLTLALMILVNTPGSWSYVYSPLLHADWQGASPTDFVFPFFLFIVGSAMVFSARALAQLNRRQQAVKILRRVALMFVIGVLLAAYPFTSSLHDWRIMGVLQRIALAYGAAAFIILYCGAPLRLLLAAAILLGYWLLLASFGSEPYSLQGNLVRHLDVLLLGESHLWQGKGLAFDPEGLLSSLPAVVSLLAGYETTRLLLSRSQPAQAYVPLLACAALMIALALAWHPLFPINKSLWSSSFVLLSSGAAIVCLVGLIALEQLPQQGLKSAVNCAYQACAIMGKNPLFIYALSFLWATSLYVIPLGDRSAYEYFYQCLRGFAGPYLASLLFALIQVALLWLVAWVLHRRNIIISL